jgi:hypothetical protein
VIERRNFKGGCEVRSDAAGHPVIAGYAAVFNTKSQKLGGERGFVEEIDSRAFEKTIREADVRALANHDPNWLLGRRGNDTLRLSTDSTGVHYEIAINEKDPDGVRALAKVERGDWDGASFGFRTIRDDWNLRSDPRERRLLEVQLRDVGPVTYPAYLETSSYATGAARSLANELGVEYRDVEKALELGDIDSIIEARAEWSTAYVNNLPDSAFLYVEDGGRKDSSGKTTPRTLRHFPYKDSSGAVDLPHLRNALARIPDSSLPQAVKDDLTAKAKGILQHNGGEEQNSIVIPLEQRADGSVAFGPEDGFVDLCDDVTTALNANEGAYVFRWACIDAALTGDRVVVRDCQECITYVAPITIGADQEPVVSDPSEWVAVEQGWVAVDDTRALAAMLRFEERAGKTLSNDSVSRIREAMSMLEKLIADAEAGSDGSGDVPGENDPARFSAEEIEARLRALQGPRRYAPGQIEAAV